MASKEYPFLEALGSLKLHRESLGQPVGGSLSLRQFIVRARLHLSDYFDGPITQFSVDCVQ